MKGLILQADIAQRQRHQTKTYRGKLSTKEILVNLKWVKWSHAKYIWGNSYRYSYQATKQRDLTPWFCLGWQVLNLNLVIALSVQLSISFLRNFKHLGHKSAVLLNQIRNHIQNRHENPKDKTGKEYRMSCQSFERMLIRVESVAKFVEEENFRKYETSRMRPKSIQVLT